MATIAHDDGNHTSSGEEKPDQHHGGESHQHSTTNHLKEQKARRPTSSPKPVAKSSCLTQQQGAIEKLQSSRPASNRKA
jgi:hypothetical protein